MLSFCYRFEHVYLYFCTTFSYNFSPKKKEQRKLSILTYMGLKNNHLMHELRATVTCTESSVFMLVLILIEA